MSNATIGFLFGIGIAAWIYARMQRSTGGNTKSSLTVAGVTGLVGFIFVTLLLGMIFH